MHYYVVGVNGSGKTTLLKAIHEMTGILVLHGTSELMSRLNIAGDYDALRKMDQDYVLVEWGKTATSLLMEYEDEDFMLDTHILNLTNGKVIRRDGPWIADYDALILVRARPALLLECILIDSHKDRSMFEPGTTFAPASLLRCGASDTASFLAIFGLISPVLTSPYFSTLRSVLPDRTETGSSAKSVPGSDEKAKLEQLSDYQDETLKAFVKLCDSYKLPSLIIENDGPIERAVGGLLDFILR